MKGIKNLWLVFCLCMVSGAIYAQGWILQNDDSLINFVSIKKGQFAEAHYIKKLEGGVDGDGNIHIVMDLNSVETNISVRNKRMQTMLFETGKYPKATLTGKIAKHIACGFREGISEEHTVEVTLDLHGIKKKISIPMVFTKISSYALQVTSKKPVLINAADFNLTKGIDSLRDIAKLTSISYAVPVDFFLTFEKKKK